VNKGVCRSLHRQKHNARTGGVGQALYFNQNETTPLPLKKQILKKIFGLNLSLSAREARGVAKKQWASIAEAHCQAGKKSECLIVEGIYSVARTHFNKNGE